MFLLQTTSLAGVGASMTALITIFGILISIGVVILTLMVKRRDILQDTNEKLIKARDLENADCEKRCEMCETTLKSLREKYRLLSEDVVIEVLAYAAVRESEMDTKADLESKIRAMQRQLDKE